MRRFLQIHLSLFLILAASAVRECEGTAERGEGGGGAGAVLEILRPQHHTVVRTQSVEIAVISSPGNDVTIHVDGKLISTVPGGRQFSVILAEEGFLSEGIHEVTVRKQVAGKIEEVCNKIYSFSILFCAAVQSALFNKLIQVSETGLLTQPTACIVSHSPCALSLLVRFLSPRQRSSTFQFARDFQPSEFGHTGEHNARLTIFCAKPNPVA